MVTQATAEELRQLFPGGQLEENRRKAVAVRKRGKLETMAALFLAIGVLLTLGALLFLTWMPLLESRFWLTIIPGVTLMVMGLAMRVAGVYLFRHSRFSPPPSTGTFLTCPNCGQEYPEKEFEGRQVSVSYE